MSARGRRLGLAALLGGAGALHLVAPDPFAGIVPPALGDPRPWVYGSGVAELACAAGLAFRRTAAPAGWATAALFVAVFPANVQMSWQARRRPRWYLTLTLARLPLQVPLVVWALRTART